MRGGIWAGLVAVVCLGVAGPAVGALTERVNVGSGGEQSDGWSWLGGISADGRYVAFDSESPLVPGDVNDDWDVFVRDRLTGTTELVSLTNEGEQGNGGSWAGPISADGRYVLFLSCATNFLNLDSNGTGPDVFLRDRLSGTTESVGVRNFGEQSDSSHFYSLKMSADARYIAFESDATNLVFPPTSGRDQIYLRDRVSRRTELVSVAANGGEADYDCVEPSVSADGRYVAFYSLATSLVPGDPAGERGCIVDNVFVRDRLLGVTEKVSGLGESGKRCSFRTAISADGRYVAFTSFARRVPGQVDAPYPEVFVRDRVAETTELVAEDGFILPHIWLSLSADGRYVTFTSGDFTGRHWQQAFVHDRASHDTGLVSLSADGMMADKWAADAEISADGRYVAFMSSSTNLVPDDTNDDPDVFVRELAGRFSDVPTFQWAYYPVEACAEAGVVGGYWDGTYRPNLEITRDQTAVFIARALAGSDALVPTAPAVATFPDVPTSHWAFRYVEYCYDQGVVSGYWDGYHPDETVNRAQMAVFLARAMAGGDGSVPDDPDGTPFFPDVPGGYWAYKYVEYCHDRGVVSGFWDGYHPEESATRAQMAVYVQRAFDLPM